MRGSDAPDLEAGVAAIRNVLKTLPVAPRRLPDAGCARRRALCRQGARAEEPRDQLHAGRAAAEAAAADGRADAVDDDRHDQHRGRGAAARGAAHQALPPAVQRAAARRQKLPLHPAARGSRLPARPASIAARGAQRGNYYGPFASAGSVTRTLNALQKLFLLRILHRQLLRQSHRGRACSTRSSAARRRASAGSTRRTMPSWSATPRRSSAASRRRCRRSSARR